MIGLSSTVVNLSYDKRGALLVNKRAACAAARWFLHWMRNAPVAFGLN